MPRFLEDGPFLNSQQGLSVDPIQDIDPAGLPCVGSRLAHHSIDLQVKQNHWIGGVIVPEIMVDFLEVPSIFSGRDLDGQDGGGEEVVTGPDAPVEIWTRIAGREVEQPQFRIYGRCVPDRRPALFPRLRVLGPAVMTHLARTGYGVKSPHLLAVFGIVGCDVASDSSVPTSCASDHQAPVIKRSTGNGVALLPAAHLSRPKGLSGLLIQGHQLAIQLTDIDFSVSQCQPRLVQPQQTE